MITISINGEDKQIAANLTIEKLLQELELSQTRLAVEINREIVPRSDFSSLTLNENDRVEIVQAIGGGSH